MKTKIFLAILTTSLLSACKKDYTCVCTNPGGVYASYNLKDTEANAKKTCDKYNEEANSVPFSEKACGLK